MTQLSNSNDHDVKLLTCEYLTKPFEELKSRVNERQRQAEQRMEQLLSGFRVDNDATSLATITNETAAYHASQITSNGISQSNGTAFNYPELFTY
jgi:DNA-binding response OmpR family regulator